MKKILSLIMVMLMVLSLAVTVSAEETTVGYSVVPSSTHSSCPAGRINDGNVDSYWHSDYSHDGTDFTYIASPPHALYITFGGMKKVSGFKYTPRQDGFASGIWDAFEVYVTKDGTTWEQVYEGTFDYADSKYQDRSERKVSWGNVEAIAMQIEVTASEENFCTCAELQILSGGTGTIINNGKTISVEPPYVEGDDDGQYFGELIEKEDTWKYEANSNDPNNGISGAFDGKINTFWHSYYEVENGTPIPIGAPYTVTVRFSKMTTVSGLQYTPRQTDGVGTWQTVNVYASTDGTNYEFLYQGNMSISWGDYAPKVISWGDTDMTAIKLEIVNSSGGFATAAEINFLTGGERQKKTFDFSKWDVTVDSVNMKNSSVDWGNIRNILDGNPDSRWHCYYESEGSVVTKIDSGPYYINMILPEKDTIEGFTYTPRSDSSAGRLLEFNINVSADDEGPLQTIYTGYKTTTQDASETVEFGIAIEVKRIQIETVVTNGSYGAISDFVFTPGQHDTEVVAIENFKEEYEKRANEAIDSTKFTAKANVGSFMGTKLTNLFDGTGTGWKSEHSTVPVTIEIDLGAKHIINGMEFEPTASNTFTGYWDLFDMMISDDGKKYTKVLEDYSFEKKNLKKKTVMFDEPLEGRYVGFVVKKYGNDRVCADEIRFLQTKLQKADESRFGKKYMLTVGSNIIKTDTEGTVTDTEIDVAPYITSVGSTLIPLRGLLEQLGATITWNDADQSINIKTDMVTIDMRIGDPRVNITNTDGTIRYTMTTYPRIKNGRTYIPLRFVSEHMGYDVAWDAATQTITIS